MATTMKVRVTVTVEVDPEAWALTYGTEPDAIREDVKSYVLNQVQASAAADEGAVKGARLQ